jgi:hypothetical protein
VADAKTRHREAVNADVSDCLEEDDHDADSESDAVDSICSDDSEPSVGSERGAGDDPLDLVKIPVDAVPAYIDRVGDELAVEYVCQRRRMPPRCCTVRARPSRSSSMPSTAVAKGWLRL